jgi:hypothetical protein
MKFASRCLAVPSANSLVTVVTLQGDTVDALSLKLGQPIGNRPGSQR